MHPTIAAVLARLNASTATLQYIRAAVGERDGDHVSFPRPEAAVPHVPDTPHADTPTAPTVA